MTIDRKVYVKKHLAALAITLIVFTIGIMIGLQVSDSRISAITNTARLQRVQFESLQLQYAFLNTAQNTSCTAFTTALDQNVYALENARTKLESYIEDAKDEEEFIIAKREYMITELRYWLLAQQAKKVCEKESVSVLFFYERNQLCEDCNTQGIILTYLKEKFKEKLLVFSLDADLEDPMIDLVKDNYNITEIPSIVVEEKVFVGFTTKEFLEKEICKNFKASMQECQE